MRAAREMGADLRALGASCGLVDLAAELPESIPVANYLALLQCAAEHLSDPLFGLHAGRHMQLSGAAGYSLVMLACKDFRAVAGQTIRFEGLAHDLGRSELVELDGVSQFRWHSPWLDQPGGRHLVESVVADIRAANNLLAGFTLPIIEITFVHARPAEAALEEYERVLAGSVRFGAEFNAGSFASTLLDVPVPTADASLFPVVTQVAEQRLVNRRAAAREPPFIAEMRKLIGEQIARGRVSLIDIAAGVAVSPRTLQRQLASANVSYSTLLDDVRRELAQQYLLNKSMSMIEISFLLGFSEQSTFNHTFRRWFGATPTDWRNQKTAQQHR